MKKLCVTILTVLWLSPLAFSLSPDLEDDMTRVEQAINSTNIALAHCATLLDLMTPLPANASEEERKKFEASLKAIQECIARNEADLDDLKKRLADLASRIPIMAQPPQREDPKIPRLRRRVKEAQKRIEEDQKKNDALKAKLKKLQNPR